MHSVGIRELKQNASAVVADVAAGETVVISDRGRPVARLTPLPRSVWAGLVESGLAHEPVLPSESIIYPAPGPSVSKALAEDRSDDRY
ncbi:type II toxin-antitoxin system Phd/YefM family antitoxin [Leifsonia aquatica]|uniref:type II toxin-antitoxin system Phd/YefM family antitoxin n=1 Tax=Leifsonia aquatica TaxID=144185 RepID=UPI0009DDF9F4|nr:type II toxin-antitoxin system prevent-host-death family antitoxin [Leifsonia aquatica]